MNKNINDIYGVDKGSALWYAGKLAAAAGEALLPIMVMVVMAIIYKIIRRKDDRPWLFWPKTYLKVFLVAWVIVIVKNIFLFF